MQTINGFDCLKAFTLSLIGYPSSCDKKLYAILIDCRSSSHIENKAYKFLQITFAK